MNKYKSLFSDTLVFGLGNFTTKLIYFFLMPIYTLSLTTEEFGLADLLNNSLQLVMPVLTLSITDAVFRFVLDKDSNHRSLFCNGLQILGYSYIMVIFITTVVCFFIPIVIGGFYRFICFRIVKDSFCTIRKGIG